MDYQEAIKEAEVQIYMYKSMILYNKDFEPKNDNSNYERKVDFLKTAISAMQEMQMYKDSKLVLIPDAVHKKQCEELDEYKQIGTLEEVREAVEKQKAKKPNNPVFIRDFQGRKFDKRGNCQRCGCKNLYARETDYCIACGQHIDWRGEE